MMQSSSELRKKARDILPGSYSMFVLAMGASFFLTTILNRFLVLLLRLRARTLKLPCLPAVRRTRC